MFAADVKVHVDLRPAMLPSKLDIQEYIGSIEHHEFVTHTCFALSLDLARGALGRKGLSMHEAR
jgi:hypothetical protein